MKRQYHADLSKISLRKFQKSLASRALIPSRQILKVDLAARFKCLEAAGIQDLAGLIAALKNKSKIADFAKQTGLPLDYLTILKREASSYLPNPINLGRLPGVDAGLISKLAGQGIKTTRHLFEAAESQDDTALLAAQLNEDVSAIGELAALSDLARLYGVGPVFARLLYDLGITSADRFVDCTPEQIVALYEKHHHKKADFTIDDIRFSIELAREYR